MAVDLRPARFGQMDVRSIAEGLWIYIPEGFAQGFQTLRAGTEVHYKVSRPFSADMLVSLDWDDPAMAVAWPVAPRRDLRSERDATAVPLATLRGVFP